MDCLFLGSGISFVSRIIICSFEKVPREKISYRTQKVTAKRDNIRGQYRPYLGVLRTFRALCGMDCLFLGSGISFVSRIIICSFEKVPREKISYRTQKVTAKRDNIRGQYRPYMGVLRTFRALCGMDCLFLGSAISFVSRGIVCSFKKVPREKISYRTQKVTAKRDNIRGQYRPYLGVLRTFRALCGMDCLFLGSGISFVSRIIICSFEKVPREKISYRTQKVTAKRDNIRGQYRPYLGVLRTFRALCGMDCLFLGSAISFGSCGIVRSFEKVPREKISCTTQKVTAKRDNIRGQ